MRLLQSWHLGVRGRKMKSSRPVRPCLKSSWVSLVSILASGVAKLQCHYFPAAGDSAHKKMLWQSRAALDSVRDCPPPGLPARHSPATASILRRTSACVSVLISQSQSPCCENLHKQCRARTRVLRGDCHHTDQNGPGLGPWSRCSGQSDWQAAAGSGRQAEGYLLPQRSPAGWKGQEVSGTA